MRLVVLVTATAVALLAVFAPRAAVAANVQRPWVGSTEAYDAVVAIDDGTTESITFGPWPTDYGLSSRPAIHLQSIHFACGATKCSKMARPSAACSSIGASGPCVVIGGGKVWPTMSGITTNQHHKHLGCQ